MSLESITLVIGVGVFIFFFIVGMVYKIIKRVELELNDLSMLISISVQMGAAICPIPHLFTLLLSEQLFFFTLYFVPIFLFIIASFFSYHKYLKR